MFESSNTVQHMFTGAERVFTGAERVYRCLTCSLASLARTRAIQACEQEPYTRVNKAIHASEQGHTLE